MILKHMYHTLIMYIYISSTYDSNKKEEPEGSSLINYLD